MIKGLDVEEANGKTFLDNSLVVWGVLLGLALWSGRGWAVAFCGAALLHLLLDLPLHHDDGRAHFWPVSNWIFSSPVSYWDPNHYGRIVGVVEIILSLALCGLLWRRFTGRAMRVLIATLALAEAAPAIIFSIMFAGT